MQWYRAPNPEQMAWRSILPWRYHMDRHQCAVFQRFFLFCCLPSWIPTLDTHRWFLKKKRIIISSSLSYANSTTYTCKSILCLQISLSLSLSLSFSLSLSLLSLFASLSVFLSVCLPVFFFNIVLSFYPHIDEAIASSLQSRYWRHTHTHLL